MPLSSVMFLRSSLVRRSIRSCYTDIQQNCQFANKRFSPISMMVMVCCGWRHSRCSRSDNIKSTKSVHQLLSCLLCHLWCIAWVFFCIKSKAVSKASSNFSSEQRFWIKWRGVPPFGGLFVVISTDLLIGWIFRARGSEFRRNPRC